ncbi:MAG: hypothetical protein WAR83_06710 [Flavobacteriales bacterium]|jgi:hypothetical protein|nr:hypothetical protein [Flavobacteriales bacterium]
MDTKIIKKHAHKHCRFKLRNGREVFGVIWEVKTAENPLQEGAADGDTNQLFFASIGDYERLQSRSGEPINVIPMLPEDIMLVESIAV